MNVMLVMLRVRDGGEGMTDSQNILAHCTGAPTRDLPAPSIL